MTVDILHLDVRCPTCSTPPRLRTFPNAKDVLDARDPERIVATYQCHVRTCNTVYEIRVKHFHDAA